MKKITVSGYDVLIGRGLINMAGEHICRVTSSRKAIIISDNTVWNLYGEILQNSLKKNGFEVSFFAFPAGEQNKNLNTVNKMLSAMSSARLTREDIVVSLGGGVVGDMAGFAAAIYLRGIGYVNIPTTLISQVDSSVGGKTGCDTEFGKNLIGAFHNPKLVLVDPDTLETLPQPFMTDGTAEIIKCGCIKSAELFEKLEKCDKIEDVLEETIFTCIDIKRGVVETDFKEKGERMLLNFGHTLGHAIEKRSGYNMAHGQAVAVGMYKITGAAEEAGYTEKGTAERIKNLAIKFNLPTRFEFDGEQLVDDILYDKKRRGDFINLVLLEKMGNGYIKKIKTEDLKNFLGV